MAAIDLKTLNDASEAEFVTALGDIFEHAPWVAEGAAKARPFPTLGTLFATFGDVVKRADPAKILALIQGHPDLAGKAARAGTLTADSTAEQTSAGLDRLSDEEYATFHRLNDAYRAKFGFPFIVCVRRHTKDSILTQFERRLEHATVAELETAVAEIMRIAALRLDQHVASSDRLKVHGRLSTHVLDTHAGHPAQGIGVELWELAAAGESRLIKRTVTNADGRTDEALIAGRPVPIGRYELRFDVGGYFAKTGAPVADPPFLDIVPVRFGVAEPEANYHVPLLVTPWSFSTYRGS
ncbi:MAG: 2-oxo-4-hydroxy-4-carboxy-5-ureidoimidazoline decarboxylase [Candidatus Eiseniibacteriota bacterium]